jgi:hypothetical protein
MLSLIERRRQVRRDRDLRIHFQRLFMTEKGEINAQAQPVLAFLRSFCFANSSAIIYGKDGRVDPLAMAANAGKQEVWQQIHNYCNLDDRDLVRLDLWLKEQAERGREPLDAG